MHRKLLFCGLFLFSLALTAQDFPAVTGVCRAGAFQLQSPLTGGDAGAYQWERSFDGGSSWSSVGSDTSVLEIPNPATGISYRLLYGTDEACLQDVDCRMMTSATRLEINIPTFSQGLSLCAGDTLYVGDTPLYTAGNHRTVLMTASGCDSIVNTFLQLKDSPDELYFIDLCAGDAFRGLNLQRDTTIVERFTSATGCDSTVRYEISVGIGSDLAIIGPERICSGETAVLRSPGQFASVTWSNGNTSSSIEVSTPGTYSLTVTASDGCRTELEHQLTVAEVTLDSVVTTPTVCPGTETGSIELFAGFADELLYSIDGGASFQQVPSFPDLPAGEYALRIENADGCAAEATAVVASAPELKLSIDQGPVLNVERGDTLQLTTETNFEVAEWRWSPAVGLSCVDCPEPVSVPSTNIEYIVEAVAPGGCAVSDTLSLIVADNRRVYAPTAFSPNGDESNQTWRLLPGPRTTSISGLQIADRWGGIRYRQPEDSLPPDHDALAWDGTDSGEPLPVGVYYYTALLSFTDGSSLRVGGSINLLR